MGVKVGVRQTIGLDEVHVCITLYWGMTLGKTKVQVRTVSCPCL